MALGRLQALLVQLEGLNLDPQLEEQLAATASAAESHLLQLQATSNASASSSSTGAADSQHSLPGSSTENVSAGCVASGSADRPSFQFIPIDLKGQRPSNTAYMNPSEKRQFGMPFKGVIPQEPPLELFVWDADSISTAGKPDVEKLVPAPAVPKPEFGSYPQAPEYTLNAELDRSYCRGWRYAAPFWTFNREQERERMLEIRMPPNVAPTRLNMLTCSFVCNPIPGMVQLPLGIPLVHQVNGDPKRAVTVVCAHTLTTLAQYKEGPQIAALVPRLMELTWGREPSGDDPGLPAIFEHIGMKTNLRSKVVNLSKFKNDGSYNLASTHGEGEGHGHFAPAVQTNTPEAAAAIKEVLRILHRLYRLVIPLCVSRFEWDMMEFNRYENNVVAFGGIEPGPTSCQGNASSAANVFDLDLPADGAPSPIHVLPSDGDPLPIQVDLDLPADGDNSPTQVDDSEQVNESEEVDLKKLLRAILESAGLDTALGPQGSPHTDLKDDPLWFTLFVLAFRLPPGSDLGAFLWMRGGIYLRETNEYLFLCSFKAQDIHSGSAPTYIKRLLDAMISLDQAKMLFKRFGIQVRFGYVLYPSLSATTHNVPILYSPTTRFLHSLADTREGTRRYYTLHGDTVLGDHRARANRLAHEGAKGVKNYFFQADVDLGLNINQLLGNATYTDEKGAIQKLDPTPIDVENDEAYEMISLYRQYYFWWMEVIGAYSLGITKPTFKQRQRQIKDALQGIGQQQKAIPTEHNLWPRLTQHVPQSEESPVLIDKILKREPKGSEAMWTVIVRGSSTPIEVAERGTSWLLHKQNREKCKEYMAKNGYGRQITLPTQACTTAAGDTEPVVVTVATDLGEAENSGLAMLNSSSPSSTLPPAHSDADGLSSGVPNPDTAHSNQHNLSAGVPNTDSANPTQSQPSGLSAGAPNPDTTHSNQRNLSAGVPNTDSANPTQSQPSNLSAGAPNPDTSHPAQSDLGDLTLGVHNPNSHDPSNKQLPASTNITLQKAPAGNLVGAAGSLQRKRKRRTPILSDSDSESPPNEPQPKRNRKGKQKEKNTPLFLPDPQSEEEQDYEVAEILDWHDDEAGTRKWRVRWAGYDESAYLWLDAKQLSNSWELLDKFNHANNLSAVESPASSALPSPTPSPCSSEDEFEPLLSKGARAKADRFAQKLELDSAAAWKIEGKELNEKLLSELLNTNALSRECQQLDITRGVLMRPSEFRLVSELPRDVASRVVDQIERHNNLSTQMYFELPTISEAGAWGSRLANLTLECVEQMGSTIPDMVALTQIHDLVSRGVQSEVCRALVAIYQWLVHLGPSLAAQLTSIHKSEGAAGLSLKFPELAPMVEHIIGFVR
ncbi:hypothetical protein DFH07DRAFT_959776 [Mycena maculata]|uniref:Chromo domain-containing protein n=1 Tax=Mycena maculata TaxID=230809 RepID=A0AAD7J0J0_9AGAR|nr:hypothetical protein DFH07DRAFT_959776 [Mycena maculata]